MKFCGCRFDQRGDVLEQPAERDVLAERHQLALDVGLARPAARQPQHAGVAHRVGQQGADEHRPVDRVHRPGDRGVHLRVVPGVEIGRVLRPDHQVRARAARPPGRARPGARWRPRGSSVTVEARSRSGRLRACGTLPWTAATTAVGRARAAAGRPGAGRPPAPARRRPRTPAGAAPAGAARPAAPGRAGPRPGWCRPAPPGSSAAARRRPRPTARPACPPGSSPACPTGTRTATGCAAPRRRPTSPPPPAARRAGRAAAAGPRRAPRRSPPRRPPARATRTRPR